LTEALHTEVISLNVERSSTLGGALKVKHWPGRTNRWRVLLPKWRRITAAVSVLVLGGVLLTAGPANAYPSTDPCMFTLYTVRGNGEQAGTQPQGRTYLSGGSGRLQALVDKANQAPDIPVYSRAIVYPATAVPNPSMDEFYLNAVATGVANLTAEIEARVAACPYVNILLAGYSQGAHVVANTIRSGSALSATARRQIQGVALYADPTYVANEAWSYNPAATKNGFFNQIRGAFSLYTHPYYPPGATQPSYTTSVRSWCVVDDAMCQNNPINGWGPHGNGYTPQMFQAGWDFMYAMLLDYN
jgi:hypothetical protein